MTKSFMDMPKYVNLRFYFLYPIQQPFASCIRTKVRLIQYPKGRTVSNQNISFLWNRTPYLLPIFVLVHESPVIELRSVRRTEYFEAFNLDHFVLEIGADLFEFLNFLLCVDWVILVLGIFVFGFVNLFIKGEVMVAGNDYFVFVGQGLNKLDEPGMLFFPRVLGEIASMNKDVGIRQVLGFDKFMKVMSI